MAIHRVDVDDAVGVALGVGGNAHSISQRGQFLALGGFIGEHVDAGGVHPRHRHGGGEAQAELGFQPGLGLGNVADLEVALIHANVHVGDVLGREVVALAQGTHRLDGGMGQVAGGVVLEADVLSVGGLGQRLLPLLGAAALALRGEEALLGFQDVQAAGEASGGEIGRINAGGSGVAGMQRLAHGAELRLEAGGLGAGDAERRSGFRHIELAHAGSGCRCAESTQGAGGMPTPCVMVGAGKAAENALGVHPDAKGGDGLGATSAKMLGQSENRRRHGNRGMAGHGIVDVVVIVGMAGRAVEQRRLTHGGAARTAHELGLGMTTLGVDFRCQDVGQRLPRTRNRNADEVHQRLAGDHPRRLGNALGARVNDALGQLPRDFH